MKRRNGFTLIELLLSLAILTLILLLVFPSINRAFNNSNEELYVAATSQLEIAAKRYAEEHRNDFPELEFVDQKIYINLEILIDLGYIDPGFINPKTNKPFKDDTSVAVWLSEEQVIEAEVDDGTRDSNNAYLGALMVEGTVINPTFYSRSFYYEITVPETTTLINVSGWPQVKSSTVTGFGILPINAAAENVFEIVVTAKDGVTTNTYTLFVNIDRPPVANEYVNLSLVVAPSTETYLVGTTINFLNGVTTNGELRYECKDISNKGVNCSQLSSTVGQYTVIYSAEIGNRIINRVRRITISPVTLTVDPTAMAILLNETYNYGNGVSVNSGSYTYTCKRGGTTITCPTKATVAADVITVTYVPTLTGNTGIRTITTGNPTCNVTTTSGYEASKVLTVNYVDAAGLSVTSVTPASPMTVTAAGTYKFVTVFTGGTSINCSITIKARTEWRTYQYNSCQHANCGQASSWCQDPSCGCARYGAWQRDACGTVSGLACGGWTNLTTKRDCGTCPGQAGSTGYCCDYHRWCDEYKSCSNNPSCPGGTATCRTAACGVDPNGYGAWTTTNPGGLTETRTSYGT